MNKDNVKHVGIFVLQIMDKYSKRKDNFEPLSKILGQYWDSIILKAVRNVLFDKIEVCVEGKTKYIWQVKRLTDCPMEVNYVDWVAKKIIEEEIRLRKLIWYSRGWGEPYKPTHEKFSFISGMGVNNSNEFFDMYWKKFVYFVPDEEKRMELMHAIFKALDDRFQDGLRVGARSYKEKMNRDHIDKLVDIYNNLEFGLSDLKKLIDE